MATSLLLKGKRAVVFGGEGSIGTAVANEYASEGAAMFLASHRARMMTGTVLNASAEVVTDFGLQLNRMEIALE
jgi:NAD(P)-dependent dehydrogenase (short-subunit alcohol dehydrogenase family)